MKFKKIISFALAAVLVLSMAGCKFSSPQNVMTIDGTEIPAGLYLVVQYQAYLNAMQQLEDSKANVLTSEIEGQKGSEWIHAKTLEDLKRYVYTEKQFAEKGLSFTEEEQNTMDTQVDQIWAYNEAVFTANGVGKESYRKSYESGQKYSKLLEAYGEDPANEVSDDDAKAYMNETYIRVQVLSLPLTGSDYDALPDDKAQLVRDRANEVDEALKSGKTLDEVGEDALKDVFEICEREYSENLLTNYMVKMFLSRQTESYPEEFLTAMFDAEVGDSRIDESSGIPMVYQKIENYESDEDFTENWREAVLDDIHGLAFTEEVEAAVAAYTVNENGSAVNTYSPSKIKTTVS